MVAGQWLERERRFSYSTKKKLIGRRILHTLPFHSKLKNSVSDPLPGIRIRIRPKTEQIQIILFSYFFL